MSFYNKISNLSNILISFTEDPSNDFGRFARGYSNSADFLSQKFLSNNGNADYDGYPIVFLYRHAFELYLKNIVYKTAEISKYKNIKELKKELQNHHDLIKLAKKANKDLSKVFPNDTYLNNLCNKIDKFASEYHEIDPTSYCYRYPIDRDGDYSTKNNQVVNIETIYDNFSPFLKDLEAIDFGLGIEKSQAKETFDNIENFNNENFYI